MRIRVTKNGPYHVSGPVPLVKQTIVVDTDGNSVDWEEGEPVATPDEYLLCRCGRSAEKPFCDGSHARVGFDGTEVAPEVPYRQKASELDGPVVTLTDAEPLCAFARFCDVGGQVWNLVQMPDEKAAALTVREATLCPSGRLIAWDRRTGRSFEPEVEPSIGIVEDPGLGISGPLWVRGGIPVAAADGTPYEIRNRVTLCRCGQSRNKPFCDGTHAAIGFRDAMLGEPTSTPSSD